MLDVLGIEGGAVGELDALTQMETPAAVGILLPFLGETRLNTSTATHIELRQRFADILHDDAADIRARRHARLEQIGLFGQNIILSDMTLLGVGGTQLFKAESAGPLKDQKLTPRIADTALLNELGLDPRYLQAKTDKGAISVYARNRDYHEIIKGKLTEEKKAEIAETIPLARLGRADDIAGACVFLASPLSTYCTGITLDVNGGMLIH